MRRDVSQTEVTIVGGGFAATALCLELRRRRPDLAPVVIERAEAGRGTAYRTRSREHLLNVPAGRMGAYADDPEHFARWLRERAPGADADTFARRGDYGAYLAELLAGSGARVVDGEAISVARIEHGFRVGLADGRGVESAACVLAPGHLPPAVPAVFERWAGDERLRADPWTPGALAGLPAGSVLLLGTGLTAVDAALALHERGHPGPMHALSRHGLLPRAHRLPIRTQPVRLPERPTVRRLIASLRDAAARSGDWRHAVDALRPHARTVWRALPDAERRRFLRHARAYWDAHRHRMAPEVAARIERLQGDGYLRVHAGRVVAVEEAHGGAFSIRWRRRGGGDESLQVASVVVCTGAAARLGGPADPLVDSLLRAGLAAPDALGLGLATDGAGRLLDASGTPTGLLALGALRVPAEWEATAVPELRVQAADLADRIAGTVHPRLVGTGDRATAPP